MGELTKNNSMNDLEIKNQIAELIAKIEPFDDIEKRHKEDAISWINSGVEIFRIERPAVPLKHLVCYTVLCDLKQQKILLLEHKTAELLLASGGHVNKNELPYDTVKREVQEELGIEAEFIEDNWQAPFFLSQIETVGKTPGHIDVDLWYILKGDSEKPLNDQAVEFQREFGAYGWYGFDEILSMSIEKFDASLHRFIKKLKESSHARKNIF